MKDKRYSYYFAAWFCFAIGIGFGTYGLYHLLKYENIEGKVVGQKYSGSRYADLCQVVNYKLKDGKEEVSVCKNGAFLGMFASNVGENINLLYDPLNPSDVWANTIPCLWLRFIIFAFLCPAILFVVVKAKRTS